MRQEYDSQRVPAQIPGYSFWVAPGIKIKRRVATKSIATFKQRVRELTADQAVQLG